MIGSHHVLVIDNYDSFVHLLADEFRRRDCEVDVYRSSWALQSAMKYIESMAPDLMVLSPGPGHPKDAFLCLELLRTAPAELAIFGVCLGFQCIIHHFGGSVERAPQIVHGKPERITHAEDGLFCGIENPMQVGRYHSLIATEIPADVVVDAECKRLVMAAHHRRLPIWGLQFHPESILTPLGGSLIVNLLRMLEVRRAV